MTPSSDCLASVDACMSNLCKSQQALYRSICGGKDDMDFLLLHLGHGAILLVALWKQWLHFLWRLRTWRKSIKLQLFLHGLNAIAEAIPCSELYNNNNWSSWQCKSKNSSYDKSCFSACHLCWCCSDDRCQMTGLKACNLTIQTALDQFPSLQGCVCALEEELCGPIHALATQCHQKPGAVFSIVYEISIYRWNYSFVYQRQSDALREQTPLFSIMRVWTTDWI